MFKIDKKQNRISKIEEKNFFELGFKEREHLQEWIVNHPDVFGEELLIIQKEFAGFSDTQERLDVLAIDKNGTLVVIENKLDDSGRDVVWQALKYASYCSSLTKENIRDIFQEYLDSHESSLVADDALAEFLEGADYEDIELNKGTSQRIILVAAKFRKEVTSTVLWLMNYQVQIQCFKVSLFSDGDSPYINFDQIIPTKDAEDYMILMADKVHEETLSKSNKLQRDNLSRKFWSRLLDQLHKEETELFKNRTGTTGGHLGSRSSIKGLGFGFRVGRAECSVYVYIDTRDKEENKREEQNNRIFEYLFSQKDKIEDTFGNKLNWVQKQDLKSNSVTFGSPGNLYDENDWNEMISFMVSHMLKLEKALKPFYGEIEDII